LSHRENSDRFPWFTTDRELLGREPNGIIWRVGSNSFGSLLLEKFAAGVGQKELPVDLPTITKK
jgi:hypothetical protein